MGSWEKQKPEYTIIVSKKVNSSYSNLIIIFILANGTNSLPNSHIETLHWIREDI